MPQSESIISVFAPERVREFLRGEGSAALRVKYNEPPYELTFRSLASGGAEIEVPLTPRKIGTRFNLRHAIGTTKHNSLQYREDAESIRMFVNCHSAFCDGFKLATIQCHWLSVDDMTFEYYSDTTEEEPEKG